MTYYTQPRHRPGPTRATRGPHSPTPTPRTAESVRRDDTARRPGGRAAGLTPHTQSDRSQAHNLSKGHSSQHSLEVATHDPRVGPET